jgi:hypothetical protein
MCECRQASRISVASTLYMVAVVGQHCQQLLCMYVHMCSIAVAVAVIVAAEVCMLWHCSGWTASSSTSCSTTSTQQHSGSVNTKHKQTQQYCTHMQTPKAVAAVRLSTRPVLPVDCPHSNIAIPQTIPPPTLPCNNVPTSTLLVSGIVITRPSVIYQLQWV